MSLWGLALESTWLWCLIVCVFLACDNKGAVHVAALHPAKNTGHTPPTSEKSHKFSSMEVLQQVKKEVIIERISARSADLLPW